MSRMETDALTGYFKWLTEQITAGNVVTENHLSHAVMLTYLSENTLLRVLGYNESLVSPQFGIIAGSRRLAVDFRVGGEPEFWLLDLKRPSESCSSDRAILQMQDYLERTGIALGVLFNGKQACAVINTQQRSLRGYSEFAGKAICITATGDLQELTAFFEHFQMVKVQGSVVTIARKLAKFEQRREVITNILKTAFENPNRNLLHCLAALPALQEISAQQKEIHRVLQTMQLVDRQRSGRSNGDINPSIRELVVEICELHGFEFLESQQIPRLRMRRHGPATQGHHRVLREGQAREGVPEGLTVGGVDGIAGLEIIRRLEELKSATPRTSQQNGNVESEQGRRVNRRVRAR
jgi:hypothetical protein